MLGVSCGLIASDPPTTATSGSVAPSATTTSVAATTTVAATSSTTILASTTTTSRSINVNPNPKLRLVIHGTGDVALDPSYIPTLRTEGYDYAWSGLEGLFENDDLTVINLECAVSDLGSPVPKAFNFRCDPTALPAAAAAGVDVANLANNHGLDYGRDALLDSIVNLTDAGIASVGAGSNYDEAYAPAIVEVNGWTIAVLGFGGVLNTRSWLATEDRAGIASGDDTDEMVAAVARAAEIADLVIAPCTGGSNWIRRLGPTTSDVPKPWWRREPTSFLAITNTG